MEELTKKEKRQLAKEKKAAEREKGELTSKTKKYVIWFVVFGILAFAGYKLFVFINTPTVENASVAIDLTSEDHIEGKQEAAVTLIEYGDFQCPACAAYYPLIKQLHGDFPDNLKVVFRHYPLTQIHKNAHPAARSAEAANLQGKFWEMHDKLYEQQEEWSNLGDPKDKFVEYADSIGLDKDKFLEDYDSQTVKDRIAVDITSGDRLGVNATPTFYLDGVKLSSVKSYQEFKDMVIREIQSKASQ